MNQDQISKLQEMLRHDLKPVTPFPSLGTMLAVLGCLSVAVLVGYWLVMGSSGWFMLSPVQRMAVLLYAPIALVPVCCSLYWSIKPGSLRRFPPGVSLAAAFGGFVLFALLLTPMDPGPEFLAHGWPCFVSSLVVFIVSAATTMVVIRGGFSVNSYLTGGLLGGLGAATSIVALQLACPHQEAVHLLVWHGSAALLALIAGYFVGSEIVARLQQGT